MYMLDMFQDVFGKIDEFGWWDLEFFCRFWYSVYLHGVPGKMSNPWCLDYVSIFGASGN